MPESLHVAQLRWGIDIVCNVANGAPLAALVHNGFSALPKMVPMGL